MTTFGLLSLPSEVVPSLKKRMDKKMQVSPSGCVEWTGTISTGGYGVTSVTVDGRTRMIGAHRASWMLSKGPIPAGLVLDHLCRVRKCVNVEHLEPITANENTARGHASRRTEPPIIQRPPWIEPSLWNEAKSHAAAEGIGVNDLVRALLRLWMDDNSAARKEEAA